MSIKKLRMLFTTAVFGLLFVGSAAQVSAATVTTSGVEAVVSGPNLWSFGTSYGADTQFTDSWSFDLAGTGSKAVTVNLGSFEFPGSLAFKINGLDAFIGTENGLSFTTSLLAGVTHTLVVSGTTAGAFGGAYAGTISAVPLPAAAWLFGSALVGFMTFARRRNQREQYA